MDSDERLLRDVREFGWHAVQVMEDDLGPGFEYSVGLMVTEQHPEIIIFGLPHDVMHGVLWEMFRAIKAGRLFSRAGQYEDVFEGYKCEIRAVHPSRHPLYLGYAMWHRRHVGRQGDLEAVQVFWPSKGMGHFPWDPGCPEVVVGLQPRLDLPADDQGR